MKRRRARRTSIFSALLLELSTILFFIALAQPTWSQLLREAVSNVSSSWSEATAEGRPLTQARRPAALADTAASGSYPLDGYR